MKTFIVKTLILVMFVWCFAPAVSLAADIFLDTNKNSFAQDEEFLVQVFLDTKNVTVNALEGTVVFPPELLELEEIRDGNSSINFWIERPGSVLPGKITFSGITAGGFSGQKMFLFGLVFRSKKVGSDSILLENIQVLQNDGLGTKIPTEGIPLAFSISKELSGSVPENIKVEDVFPPEDFVPLIGNDPTILDGKYFLVFSATDKGIGIDHYEVREGLFGGYDVAQSPHLLKDQSLRKNIYIKAIDRSGNERLVKIKAQNPTLSFELILIFGILLVIICVFLFKKIWSKFARR